MRGWQPIETAPTDGTLVWVYTASAHDLSAFQGPCAWHPDAGWCTDELRCVTHWVPLRDVYLPEPEAPPRVLPSLGSCYGAGSTGAALQRLIARYAWASVRDGSDFATDLAVVLTEVSGELWVAK